MEVRTQHPVQPPAQFVDVIVASEHCDKAAMWEALGWLGKMACQSTLIEVFSRAVPEDAARDCVRKQLPPACSRGGYRSELQPHAVTRSTKRVRASSEA